MKIPTATAALTFAATAVAQNLTAPANSTAISNSTGFNNQSSFEPAPSGGGTSIAKTFAMVSPAFLFPVAFGVMLWASTRKSKPQSDLELQTPNAN
jgi:hypothetical protein